MQVIAEAYGAFIRAMADADYDPSSGVAPPEDVMEAVEDLSASDIQEASEAVQEYFETECGTTGAG